MKLALALVLAATTARGEPVDDPDHVAMAAALRSAFGTPIWRHGIEVHDVSCRAGGERIECTLRDRGRLLRATGAGAGAVIDELASVTGDLDVATIVCQGHHCGVEHADGDWRLLAALEAFEMDSLGQHTRTMSPVDIHCAGGRCSLGPEIRNDGTTGRIALAGSDAEAIARVLARRLDEPCGASPCNADARVECDSSGIAGDDGLTARTTCDVMP